jgi:Fe-S-cluster containining protein
MEEKEFYNNCEACGAQCCRNWNIYQFDPTMVDKYGVCIYLNQETNKCTIYDTRPVFCRVHDYYVERMSSKMSFEEYMRSSYVGCKVLQNMGKRRNKDV